MTEAEKALDRLSNETNFVEAETIRKTLQGVDESNKCAWLWMQKHKALNDKSQGLLKALEAIIKFIPTHDSEDNEYEQMKAARKAMDAFNSDETGVEL